MASKNQGKELRDIISRIREGTFEYESRDEKKTNWTKYNQAQIHEMSDFLNNIRDLVGKAKIRIMGPTAPDIKKVGRPPIDPFDIVKVLLLQTYTGSPNRVAEGLLLLFGEKLGISKHFSYKTIERGYDKETVNDILDEVTKITNKNGTKRAVLNKNGKYFVDIFSDTTTTREYSIVSTKGKMIQLLQEDKNPLADYAIGKMSVFSIKADDGTDLY